MVLEASTFNQTLAIKQGTNQVRVMIGYYFMFQQICVNKLFALVMMICVTYWFPKLTEHVKKYISSCLKCIIFSPKEGKGEGLLNLIDKGNTPFQTIHIDHFGPINQTK
ncbi:Uncharacterized protein FWK35_00018398 [Aphis craccivora]|uniref:Integrase zinc-binding domain-containing protein n=1 Tax=Aphis craccivora TaxID=307492 RepID=A0A6G0XU95_APHCR|nr:Uncharacterized protein FWK35_00018398 [Aphis craccivora]